MAIQLWQQILLSDPNSTEALAGLAKDLKLIGSSDQANEALQRLRKINPNDPNIPKIAALTSTRMQSDQLRQAGELARQGKTDQAMRIYRDLFGDRPPDGDIALAYYQTLYGTAGGKEPAVAAMRALAQRNPGDTRFSIELGRMLTYDARTRAEGVRILKGFPRDSIAQSAIRQALIWDAANPASTPELREYLHEHPQDSEISADLKQDEAKLAQMNSGIARSPAERAAFAALNAHRLEDAQTRFNDILELDPANGRAAAGMGFLRMQQGNFGGAISFLTQAEDNGFKARPVEDALVTSRFWFTMGEAAQAFDANQLDVAAAKYHDALAMRPRSPEALIGLAGLLMKEQQYSAAAESYEQLLKMKPGSVDAWSGLFLAYARDGENEKALALAARFPASVKSAETRDPEYLRTLAAIYQAENRGADAQRVLAQALALPFPGNGVGLKQDTRLQYASILMEARRFDQAAELYTQILNDDSNSLPAWMGLISAQHELTQDNQAISDVERMPPSVYESALGDPGFLSMMGAIYQQANQFEIAQSLLERSVRIQIAAGSQPGVALQLQLASIYLLRNNTAQAYAIYQQVLLAHPDRVEAWKGLIAALQVTNRTTEALQQIALIPPAVRKQLDTDIEFVQTEASLYAANGDNARAVEYMLRVQNHYASIRQPMPASVEIQNAWLLFNTKNDRALYPELMRLGGRQDLTPAQRETVQTIWANWSVRRATAAIHDGNLQRGVEILDAASQAFPDNLTVRKAVAGGYLSAGEAKESLALFKTIPLQDGSAADFAGAIGAALAANDMAQAETWLRQALDRFATDPAILALAARFEQARGNNQRAADYWRASLAAMPQVSPTDKLAHTLDYPEQGKPIQRAATPADLQQLLNPDNEPFPKTTKLPPLPAYGPDPYSGAAPVVIGQQQPAVQPTQPAASNSSNSSNSRDTFARVPTTTTAPVPASPAPANAAPPFIPTAQVDVPIVQPSSPRNTAEAATGTSYTAKPAASKPSASKPARAPKPKSSSTQSSGYTGKMNLPVTGESINSTEPVSSGAPTTQPTQPPAPQAVVTPPSPAPAPSPTEGLRITSQPMDGAAARIQVQFADQTDAQLTQGSASAIRTLANAPVNPPLSPPYKPATQAAAPSKLPPSTSAAAGQYSAAQYTPSAQEAATGAYSAPKQQQQQNQQQPPPPPLAAQPLPKQPIAPATTSSKKKKTRKSAAKTQQQAVPTLVTAPGTEQGTGQNPQQNPPQPQVPEVPPQATPTTTNQGLSDEELQQRNLPPLRGPWVKVEREQRTTSPRDEAEMQLRGIESGYSAWLGGTGLLNYRSGQLGYDHLSALEAPFEASMPFGYNARMTFIAKPVFLDSGQATGSSVVSVLESASPGAPLTLTVIPQPLGTETATDTSPPPQQNAAGIAGEVQLTFPHLSLAAGYTPYGFLIGNFTARAQWRPASGPFTFNFSRDPVKDSQLSYAGLRDPSGNTLGNEGPIWGGVMSNQGSVQFARGDAQSGYYLAAGGQYLNGTNTQSNTRYDFSGGAYWRVYTAPEYGTLNIGANFFAMHYEHNQLAYTFGMGGYFSPQAYLLANVPFSWAGHSGTRWHYNILGALGVQAFQEKQSNLFPLAGQNAEEVALGNPALPALTSVGPNYDLRGQVAYAISPHWFAGGSLSANNARNYTSVSVGFYIRYLFRPQPSTVAGPTGIFPTDGFRPFRVP
jgi:tetratricopeptide (TPR) repeat protein